MKKLTPAQVDETLYCVQKELTELLSPKHAREDNADRITTLRAVQRKLQHNLEYIKVAHNLKRAEKRKEHQNGHCTEVG